MTRRYVHVEGSIYRRGDWYYARKMVNGHRPFIALGTQDLNEARREAARVVNEMYTEVYTPPSQVPTFRQWWDTYQQTYTVKKSAGYWDAQMMAPALPHFEKMKMPDIKKSDCEAYLTKRGKNVAPATLARERGFLQAVFQQAVYDEVIGKNPFVGIDRIDWKARERVLSHAEQLKLFQACTPRLKRWLVFMLGTGLRIAEACAIERQDIDRIARLIHVPAYAAKFKKGRSVPLYPAVQDVIEEQLAEMGQLWNATPWSYRKALYAACEKAGIEQLSPHALRHTFGTRFMEEGGDIYVLSQIMGHASVKTTEKNYLHVRPATLVDRAINVDVLKWTPEKPALRVVKGTTR